jgi:4-alpha-glucanotransferase
MTPDLLALCALTGVRTEYRDQLGEWRTTEAPTARAILTAMGHPAETDAEAAESLAVLRAEAAARRVPAYVVVPAGEASEVAGADLWEVETETGELLSGEGRLPALPMGIHRLRSGGSDCLVIAAPVTLPLPERAWGVTLPLYGLRTPEQGGLGDFADLGQAVRALSRHGAAFAGVNPIHAGFFPAADEISPYAPSHRRRFNAAFIPVADGATPDGDLVDYRAAYAARWRALEAAFAEGPDAGFETFAAEGGGALRAFAVHQTIAEAHGAFWHLWPEALRDRGSPEVAVFAAANADRVRFHMWLQYRAEAALAEVAEAARAMRFGLYLDVAVGTHPFGAETWLEPECFARGVSIGAPPDAFSKDGQVWGLAPLNPRGLIAAGFRPVAEMLRQQFRFSKLDPDRPYPGLRPGVLGAVGDGRAGSLCGDAEGRAAGGGADRGGAGRRHDHRGGSGKHPRRAARGSRGVGAPRLPARDVRAEPQRRALGGVGLSRAGARLLRDARPADLCGLARGAGHRGAGGARAPSTRRPRRGRGRTGPGRSGSSIG